MTAALARNSALTGILCAVVANVIFSANDVIFKFLSGEYALHQMVLIRAGIGILIMLALIMPLSGGWHLIRTAKPGLHLMRGAAVVISNLCYFLALAALPLADAVAIFFVAPLLVTALSVPILGEKVGPRRWIAVLAGLLGVVVMLRPGSTVFDQAALLPLVAALAYALMHMLTRGMKGTESAVTMTFYVQLSFVVVSAGMGIVFGSGQYAGSTDPSLAFLFRGWVWPETRDWALLGLAAVTGTTGGILIGQAYKHAEAGLIAPFEYTSMPLAIFWGAAVFGQWPDTVAWAGIALICGSGLYVAAREAQLKRRERRRGSKPAAGSDL